MRLSDCVGSRDNNLNLLRIVAALAVLIGHSFALLAQAEPWGALTGMTPGSIAVDVFFIVSGMLVTGSLVNKRSAIDYICSRALRIFPALLCMLLLTVFVLGPYFSSLPLTSYLLAPETRWYLLKCATLFSGVVYVLPGVFAQNPYPYAVNGSLWTMPYEIMMYFLLLVFWSASILLGKTRKQVLEYVVLTITFLAALLVFGGHFYLHYDNNFVRLLLMFFSGASLFLYRKKIVLSRQFFYPLLLSVLVVAFTSKPVFFALYNLAIAYLVVCFAYLPVGPVRRYNSLGDYSYGVYIYAFPVQQAIVALFPGIAIWNMALASGLVTILLAVLSWHLVEKPSLAWKHVAVARLRKYLPPTAEKPATPVR